MDVSVLVPLYQAAALLETSVAKIDEVLSRTAFSYEILLRNDGSSDRTAPCLDSIACRCPQVRIFSNPANQGLGATLRALIHDAVGERMIYCDVDLPFGAEILPEVLTHLRENDLVVVSRYAGARNRVGLQRKIFSRGYYGLCRWLFRVPVRDIGSGTVGITKRAAGSLALNADGFDIHLELIALAADAGLVIREIPAPCHDEGRGSFSVWRHGPATAARTLSLWRRLRKTRTVSKRKGA